jgi:ParB family chromosome partitioning protein
LRLPLKVQESLIDEKISAGHARALINIENEEIQLQLLDRILTKNLSVRSVEKMVREYNEGISQVKKKPVSAEKKSVFFTPNLRDVEDKLRTIFGTKVSCSQRKDGSGEITLEYYSNDELERLLELFEGINKTYS